MQRHPYLHTDGELLNRAHDEHLMPIRMLLSFINSLHV